MRSREPRRQPVSLRPVARLIRRRGVLPVAVLALGLTSSVPAASAAAPRAQVSARVTTAPTVVFGVRGDRTVGASGDLRRRMGRSRAVLQLRVGARVRSVAAVRLTSMGAFQLRWRVPRRLGAVKVRVRVVRGHRTLAQSPWRRLTIPRGANAGVVVPRPSTVTSAPPPGEAGSLVLGGTQAIAPGKIIAVGVTPATPSGFLGRVISTTTSTGQTVLATEPASLPDVLPTGSIDSLVPVADLPPVATATRTLNPGAKLGELFSCSGSVTASASATVRLTAGVKMSASWSLFSGVKASLTGNVGATASAQAGISGKASCDLADVDLLATPLRFGTYAFSVAGIPIVLQPEANITVSGNITAKAALSASASASISGTAGIKYENGHFSPTGGFTESTSYSPPTVTAGASASLTVAPSIFVRVNGIAGPVIDVRTGLSFVADPSASPWWKLSLPIDVGARLALRVWKISEESPRLSIYSKSIPLADSGQAPSPATPPSTLPEPTLPAPDGSRMRATMSWDSTADIDLYTWDDDGNLAYFSHLTDIPDAQLLEDVIPGFGPEEFVEFADYGRHYTFGVCMYGNPDDQPTTVTVTLTDLDGTQQTFTEHLSYLGDSALVGDSPKRTMFSPGSDWCRYAGG